jgi:hypothetical protein
VRQNLLARTLHHEKRAVNPLLKTPLTFLSDWEESPQIFSGGKGLCEFLDLGMALTEPE